MIETALAHILTAFSSLTDLVSVVPGESGVFAISMGERSQGDPWPSLHYECSAQEPYSIAGELECTVMLTATSTDSPSANAIAMQAVASVLAQAPGAVATSGVTWNCATFHGVSAQPPVDEGSVLVCQSVAVVSVRFSLES